MPRYGRYNRLAAAAALLTLTAITSYYISISAQHGDRRSLPIKEASLHDDLDAQLSSPARLRPIPKKIWQINYMHPKLVDLQHYMWSWILRNPRHGYTLLNKEAAELFVRTRYGIDSKVTRTFMDLHNTILRSDYLRYLVLAVEGGVYSDLDTSAVKPVDKWVPRSLKDRVHAVIGLEYDILDDETMLPRFVFEVQFCQWTLAISARHPLMKQVVQNVTSALHQLAAEKNSTLKDLLPFNDDVLRTTGPAKWSEVVYEYLTRTTGTEISWKNFTGMEQPVVVADVMVVPINAFAVGVPHSGSSEHNTEDTLARHHFKGSWRVGG
ncbi:MAG: hypothetical protein LQ351_004212 [Letrouitia transgressa]|nr:MAG: hypothetical protein LQ351_004212 [Letrouitia transgressa]